MPDSLTSPSTSLWGLSPAQDWLLVVAAGIVLFSLLEAWLATLVIYGKNKFLKSIFPSTHNLIRSHIDYVMMAGLLGLIFIAFTYLAIEMPVWAVLVLCFGVIWNPFGFFVRAIDPSYLNDKSLKSTIIIYLNFLPATIGFGYAMIMIMTTLLTRGAG